MLPPPTYIDHLDEASFHELQVYDAARMAQVVNFASAAEQPGAPTFKGTLGELLRQYEKGASLPHDLILDLDTTRLQHFECLGSMGEASQKAARAVLALCPAKHY